LEKLALVKSFIIVTSLEEADVMVTQLFRHFFETASHPQLQNVYASMVKIRTQLAESMDLNQDVVGLLLKYLANGDTVTVAQHAMGVEVYDTNVFIFRKRVNQVMHQLKNQAYKNKKTNQPTLLYLPVLCRYHLQRKYSGSTGIRRFETMAPAHPVDLLCDTFCTAKRDSANRREPAIK
jgi:hypothetical protein